MVEALLSRAAADMRSHFIEVPEIVRMKPGALSRLGLYLARPNLRRVFLVKSHGLVPEFVDTLRLSIADAGVELLGECEVTEASVEAAVQLLGDLPRGTQAIIGLGGGKALDVGKYLASLSGLSYFATPTSLSNDGFCSPQASLTLRGRRKSLATGLPYAVIVDTGVCLGAPSSALVQRRWGPGGQTDRGPRLEARLSCPRNSGERPCGAHVGRKCLPIYGKSH